MDSFHLSKFVQVYFSLSLVLDTPYFLLNYGLSAISTKCLGYTVRPLSSGLMRSTTFLSTVQTWVSQLTYQRCSNCSVLSFPDNVYKYSKLLQKTTVCLTQNMGSPVSQFPSWEYAVTEIPTILVAPNIYLCFLTSKYNHSLFRFYLHVPLGRE